VGAVCRQVDVRTGADQRRAQHRLLADAEFGLGLAVGEDSILTRTEEQEKQEEEIFEGKKLPWANTIHGTKIGRPIFDFL